LYFPSNRARHEITCDRPALWIILAQIGGRYEHRAAPDVRAPRTKAQQWAMSLVPAGMTLWGYASKIRFVHALRLTFDPEALSARLAGRLSPDTLNVPRLMFSHDGLWQIGSLLAGECGKWATPDDLFGESLATALCVELFRQNETNDGSEARGGLAPWQVRRLIDHVRAHMCEAMRLKDLASIVGMSQSHFSRAFRASTGLPPYRWILNVRVQHAQELLLQAELSLAEVALRTGFADQSHFTRSFQSQTGTSPGAWRREFKS
jgi:AraC-like DNA-binding protein